jgi:biotin synthase
MSGNRTTIHPPHNRMTHDEIADWLRETDVSRLDRLWREADRVRQENVGDDVHLRGLIELSNHCVRLCGYCGLRAENRGLKRYRMSAEDILACARKAVDFGYGTVVLQSGEDPNITPSWMESIVRHIKSETPLAITLSLGERDDDELAAWHRAGADRYLLRFETCNRQLYEHIHPPRRSHQSCDRIAMLDTLRGLGYEVGSGVMIGIPGQTYDDLANDIELFARLDLDMIGVGPYLPHPDTPLGALGEQPPKPTAEQVPAAEQVPGDELTTYKVMAIARLMCPGANIPSTTALATLNSASGRELGLVRGANVIMPNLTPVKYRALYEIYPGKVCISETADDCRACINGRIRSLGRQVGSGPGDSPNFNERNYIKK